MIKKVLIICLLIFTVAASLLQFDPKISAQSEPVESVQNIVRFSENFDAVSAPQIPNGWTISTTGTGVNFATVTNNFDTAPNAVFAPALATTGSSEIISPPTLIAGATDILRFRNRYSVENTWDGGVLEIKIGGGNFQDIIDAGGTFISGGYTTLLNSSTNPLANRFAWSGASSNGYVSTAVRLPASAFGQFVQFRWRLGTNNDFGVDGWWIDSITLETVTTGANTNQINISSSGTASPYPSAIQISGLNGVVTDIAVGLESFSHTLPDDVDILLVSPNGRSIILMSDTGGNTAANNVNLTFTDAAAQNLSDNSALATGIYKPTEFESPDTFPSPAPQIISGTSLSAFYGSNPNGTWSLYAVDDQGNNAGSIAGGWNLSLKTSLNACFPNISTTAQSFSSLGGTGSFQISSPAGCDWSISTNNPFITFNSPPNGTGTTTVIYTVAANSGAARTGLITVSDGFNNRTLQIQQGSGCPTSLSQESLSFSAAGGSGTVQVTASGNCNWQASSNVAWIQITSAQQTGNGTASFTIAPNTSGNIRNGIVSIGSRTLFVNQISARAAKFDFDGDGKSDISVFRSGNWFLQQSANGFAAVSFGIISDKLVPADYDGDGKTDIAVYRDGNWYILQSSNNSFRAAAFGLASDLPVPNDFDGDGRSEVAVFRSGTWFTLNLSNNQFSSITFGQTNDKPVPADFDGDGRTDFAVYRSGIWYVLRSQTGFAAVNFGLATDKPVPADYDGNGQADLAVFRDGNWYQLLNLQTFAAVSFGQTADLPVAADYDGDGKTDVGVFRGGNWYILQGSDLQFRAVNFGLATDKPIPNS